MDTKSVSESLNNAIFTQSQCMRLQDIFLIINDIMALWWRNLEDYCLSQMIKPSDQLEHCQ